MKSIKAKLEELLKDIPLIECDYKERAELQELVDLSFKVNVELLALQCQVTRRVTGMTRVSK